MHEDEYLYTFTYRRNMSTYLQRMFLKFVILEYYVKNLHVRSSINEKYNQNEISQKAKKKKKTRTYGKFFVSYYNLQISYVPRLLERSLK